MGQVPTFLSLEEWGGTPNGWPDMTLPSVAVWAHHSVTNETIGVQATEDAIADLRNLDAEGLSRGHGGISYSYAIHPEGVIGEGQGHRRGAHTAGVGCNGSPYGWNPCSFGICFIGDFHPRWIGEGDSAVWFEGDVLTGEAINSFRWLRDQLIADGLLEPGVYPTGGHRDAPGNPTACPGDNIESRLDELRQPWTSTPTPEDDDMPEPIYRYTGDGAIDLSFPDGTYVMNKSGEDILNLAPGVAFQDVPLGPGQINEVRAQHATPVGVVKSAEEINRARDAVRQRVQQAVEDTILNSEGIGMKVTRERLAARAGPAAANAV